MSKNVTTLNKRRVVRVSFPKKAKKPKKAKYRKKMCDRCKRRFDHDELRIFSKLGQRGRGGTKTHGMNVVQFDKFYEDKRKRPVHDRRENILRLCNGCFEEESRKRK